MVKKSTNKKSNNCRNFYTGIRACASSMLMQWPCRIDLVPPVAPYFDGANILIAADCTAFAYGNFHNDFMKDHVTLIACPKLDFEDYANKLGKIIANNDIKSIKLVRMEVSCCNKMEEVVEKALLISGKNISPQLITISTDGKILECDQKGNLK